MQQAETSVAIAQFVALYETTPAEQAAELVEFKEKIDEALAQAKYLALTDPAFMATGAHRTLHALWERLGAFAMQQPQPQPQQ